MRKEWTRSEERRLCEARIGGAKIKDLALQFGRTFASVQQRLTKLRCLIQPWRNRFRSRRPGELRAAVKRLLTKRQPVTAIADMLGVSHSCVSVIRRQLNLPPVSYSERGKLSWNWRRGKGAK
jgi:hypothetical protein